MESGMSRIDEDLEVKALRRVISAYLDYPSAAEEDIRRWERSYSKLHSSHKALLPHLPRKYQELRRCVAANSYFLINMLQAFDPPFDMGDGGGCVATEDAGIIESHSHTKLGVPTPRTSLERDEDRTTAKSLPQNPKKDAALASPNGNAHQAVECSGQGRNSGPQHSGIMKYPLENGISAMQSKDSSTKVAQAEEGDDAMERRYSRGKENSGLDGSCREGFCNDQTTEPDTQAVRSKVKAYGAVDLNHPSYQLHVPSADVDKGTS